MKTRINIMAVVFCLYLAAVAVLCFAHADKVPDMSDKWWGIPSDKAAHFLMFLPFTPLSYMTFRRKNGSFWRKMLVLTTMLLIGAMIAFLTEIVQDRLSSRSYETKDLLADGIGLITGYAAIASGLLIKKSRKTY